MNVLAVGAHPDDLEVLCGGTLAKYASLGHKVFMATATNGNIGSAKMPKEEIAVIRKEEARQSAAIIGAEYICLDFDDEYLPYTHEARDKFIDLVRYCKPDVILTHNQHDYLTDHEFTGKIINDIIVLLPIVKIQTKNPPCQKQPAVYHFGTSRELNFCPTDYVDITDFYETKKQMFMCHKSQMTWLSDNLQAPSEEEDDFMDTIRIPSEFRGWQCGVKYAEGFVKSMDAYRLKPGNLLP